MHLSTFLDKTPNVRIDEKDVFLPLRTIEGTGVTANWNKVEFCKQTKQFATYREMPKLTFRQVSYKLGQYFVMTVMYRQRSVLVLSNSLHPSKEYL